jgi:hypothetical protein
LSKERVLENHDELVASERGILSGKSMMLMRGRLETALCCCARNASYDEKKKIFSASFLTHQHNSDTFSPCSFI